MPRGKEEKLFKLLIVSATRNTNFPSRGPEGIMDEEQTMFLSCSDSKNKDFSIRQRKREIK